MQDSGLPPGFVVRVQVADFDVSAELRVLHANDGRVGAIASFVGTVRSKYSSDTSDGLQSLELEHYPGMTERAIEAMMRDATARFGIFGATVIHRVGMLKPCEQIVLVAVTSAHRGKSFEACEFLMDYLKTQAPFWKREARGLPDGRVESVWVDAREADDAALLRWGVVTHNA